MVVQVIVTDLFHLNQQTHAVVTGEWPVILIVLNVVGKDFQLTDQFELAKNDGVLFVTMSSTKVSQMPRMISMDFVFQRNKYLALSFTIQVLFFFQ